MHVILNEKMSVPCTQEPKKASSGCWICGNWKYSQLWTALWVLENDPESSVRIVASFLNHGTISLGPFCSFAFWDSISGIPEWSWICYIPPAGLKHLNLLSLPPEYWNCLCFFLIRKIILSTRKIIMTFSYWSRQKNISPPFYGSACKS